MATFAVNAARRDPYKNFKFKVFIDGQMVAALQKCTGLKRTTEMSEWRSGEENSIVRKMPGRSNFAAITLEQGLTHDKGFETWANQVANITSDADTLPVGFRKDIQIQVLNESGQVALSYNVFRCWVSEYQSIPDLDANGHAIAITTIKLENEGWQRDESAAEPSNP